MKLESLKITNFRGIHDMKLDFRPGINVLVGVNGAGKSTVLDAVSVVLSRVVSLIRSGKNAGKDIAAYDISAGKKNVQIQAVIGDQNLRYGWGIEKNLDHSLKIVRADKVPGIEKNIRELTDQIRDKIQKTDEKCSIPVIVYYQASRVALRFPRFVHTDRDFSLMSVYQDALSCRADYRVLLEWFRERQTVEDREFKRLVLESQTQTGGETTTRKIVQEYHDLQLQTLRRVWEAFMPEFSNFVIEQNPLRLEAQKKGGTFRVDQLSDGEKSILALVGDIARRLAIANPTLENPLEGEAIILIDEIDLHFHPKRQRMLTPQILKMFPNCQFIVATHSPQILGHVPAECIFLLVENEDGVVELQRPEESLGMTSDEILEDLMQVPSRAPDEEEKLLHLFELIERKKLAEAKALVDEIRHYRRSEPKLLVADARILRLENMKDAKSADSKADSKEHSKAHSKERKD